MGNKIYYMSNYDYQVHNINDVKYKIVDENSADILDGEGFVIDQVNIHTFDSIMEIIQGCK